MTWLVENTKTGAYARCGSEAEALRYAAQHGWTDYTVGRG